MGPRRFAVVVTCVAVALVGATFSAIGWGSASSFVTVASVIAALVAIGIAVWAALPETPPEVYIHGFDLDTSESSGRHARRDEDRADEFQLDVH